jgi:hypothetical protein
MLEKAKKELEDAKASVDRAKDEAKCLRVAAASVRLRSPSRCVVREWLVECVRETSGGGGSGVPRWIATRRGGEEQPRQERMPPGTQMGGWNLSISAEHGIASPSLTHTVHRKIEAYIHFSTRVEG